ncbi:metallophosphoesterase family protein [Maridesulfovibrio salexigens]|uniref:Metallophosphoesterase n=1 Tax=Maridesulfovibrio salexigens (strain ATCC 14822 / DSM 2638 / NCIMB 8403 / VKM B-1763) TaxID=526222 RepID=C6BTG9_MARSD|nr:metallophosphoesterase family protein [Maridesulfovibrio salexigens]ACS81650.1 metallophosphoesterase [Maridesulfovibrio salexigens DSM 2638]
MIGIISDIHGNYVALKEVLARLDFMGITEIYCLGDVVGYYSQINECCEELQRRNILCVMGNHDWYFVAKSFCPRSKSVNDCLGYQRKIITKENLRWLSSFPVFHEIDNIFMVHGGWADPIDEYLIPERDYFSRIEGRFFASGHTHVQQVVRFEELDKIYCNPGSVGQPRDLNPHAAFAVFDGNEFSLHRVSYDIGKVGRLMEKAGFSGYYYGCLMTGASRLQWAEKDTD